MNKFKQFLIKLGMEDHTPITEIRYRIIIKSTNDQQKTFVEMIRPNSCANWKEITEILYLYCGIESSLALPAANMISAASNSIEDIVVGIRKFHDYVYPTIEYKIIQEISLPMPQNRNP